MEMNRWLLMRASIYLFIMGFVRRMTIGVRAVLVDGDKVLLLKHSYIPGWHFPGGGVDPGETIDEGMRREVMEETGYRVGPGYEIFGHYLNVLPPARDHVALFICRNCIRERDFKPNGEIIDIQWFAHDALPEDVSQATRARIEEIFSNKPRNRAWKD